MIVSVHQPHYLPWLGYFDKIARSDCFVFLDRVQYKRREYQNRNKIRSGDRWTWLTVPVISRGLRVQPIGDVRIDNSSRWQEKHWRSMNVCYGKARFFKDHAPFFREVYENKTWDLLVDLNVCVTRYILKNLGIDRPLYFESEMDTTRASTERIVEICRKLGADVYLSGTGGREYLDEGRFAEEGIELRYQDFKHPVYSQCSAKGKEDFIPDLAAVDLLFNEGTGKEVRN